MIKILYLFANPTGTTPLQLGNEWRDISARLRAAEHRDRITVEHRTSVRAGDITQAMLEFQPHILHFSGHGEEKYGLVIHNDSDGRQYWDAAAVAALCKQHEKCLRMVVLNACYSDELVEIVGEQMDFVVGMSDAIRDDSAVAFATGLYQALGAGSSVREAIENGKTLMKSKGLPHAELVELKVREGANADAPLLTVPSRSWLPPQNRFFTGREADLERLHKSLTQDGRAAVTQAISGLGGVGKTALAIQYAYRFEKDYPFRFLVNASSPTTLYGDYRTLAQHAGCPIAPEAKDDEVVQAVKHWLDTHDDYLLILDNADFTTEYTPQHLKAFLPDNPKGRLLLTSRSQTFPGSLGVKPDHIQRLEIMSEPDALAFLKERVLGEDTDWPEGELQSAEELAKELGYLPLALEQAAAYIAARQTTFRSYLALYHKQEVQRLEKAKAETGNYERTVATTWQISFNEVKKAEPAAADLLTLCAFLAPENIPLEVVIAAAGDVVESLTTYFGSLEDAEVNRGQVDELLEPLTHYSLATKDNQQATFNVHRLVQAVQRHALNANERKQWTETTLKALNTALCSLEFENWPTCARLTPHVQAMETHRQAAGIVSENAARLLNKTAHYLDDQTRYEEAEPLHVEALAIRRKSLPEDHPNIAASLNNLALLYEMQGRYKEAEPMYVEALAMRRKSLPEGHPYIASSLNNLAELYRTQTRYEEAEPLYGEALAMRRKSLPEGHPDTAQSLNNLARLYESQGHYEEAEPLYREALAILRKALGDNHPNTKQIADNLQILMREKAKRNGRSKQLFNLFTRWFERLKRRFKPSP